MLTSSLPPAQGGVGLVEVPTQIKALQAKVVSRLLELERLAWKVFQLHHLSSAPHTRALAYGATILFSTVSISCLQLPARLTWYVTAFKALQPHRLLKVDAMPAEDVLNEPMAFTNTCGFFHCIFVMNVSPTQKKKKMSQYFSIARFQCP